MPRKARIVIPGVAHHVVQRGHNRQVVFAADEDFQFYLENLTELKGELDVRLYAYCLMTNHVHLLLMPAQGQTLASLLKALAGRQTRYVNRVEGRSGTLWEGRYKSSPVDTESYLLECSRYIELNPLRAGIVGRPEQYRWSSFGAKAGLWEDRRLDLDPCYLAMGETEQQRQSRYAAFVSRGVRPSELMLIREALQRGQLTGSERFVDEIDRKLGVRVERRGQGRPAKCKKNKSVPFSACRASLIAQTVSRVPMIEVAAVRPLLRPEVLPRNERLGLLSGCTVSTRWVFS